MSIQTIAPISITNGTGAAQVVSIPVQFHSNAEVKVYLLDVSDGIISDETLLVEGVGYTLSKTKVQPSAPIVYTGSISPITFATTSQKIVIFVDPANQQTTDFSSRPYSPAEVELADDLSAYRDAAIRELVKRCARLPLDYTGAQPIMNVGVNGSALVWYNGNLVNVDLSGLGGGDMLRIIYDPQSKLGDPFPYDTMAIAAAAAISPAIHSIEIRGMNDIEDGLGGVFIDTDNGSTATFTSNGGARTWYRALTDVLNIKWFGAKGDGINNDLPAFNVCMLAARSLGIGRVFLPAGTYLFVGVAGPSWQTKVGCLVGNVELYGDGLDKTIIKRGSIWSMLTTEWESIPTIGYTGPSNIHMHDLCLDGNVVGFPVAANLTYWQGCENIVVERVFFKDTPGFHALDINSCRNFKMDNIDVRGTIQSVGADAQKDAIQISHYRDAGGNSVMCENIQLTNSYIGKSDTPGVTDGFATGIGEHFSTHNLFTSGVQVWGNIIEDCTYAGIRFYKFKNSLASQNIIRRCVVGVMLTSVPISSMSSQNQDGTESGVAQAGSNTLIVSNTFEDCANQAILACSGTDTFINAIGGYAKHSVVSIVANIIRNAGTPTGSGIQVGWATGVTIADNLIDNVNRGIIMRFVDNVTVSGNKVTNTLLEGVYITETVETVLAGLGLTRDILINGNRIFNVPYTGILAQLAMSGLDIVGNAFSNISTIADNTRPCITYSAGVTDSVCEGNISKDGGAANKPSYLVNVTGSCTGIRVSNNHGYGKTAVANHAGTGHLDSYGSGSPEGIVASPAASTYMDETNSVGYIKYGSGNTGWAKQPQQLTGSMTKDWASIAAGGTATQNVTVTGAAFGMSAFAVMSVAHGGLLFRAEVTSANTVTVTASNPTAGAIDLGSATLYVDVLRR